MTVIFLLRRVALAFTIVIVENLVLQILIADATVTGLMMFHALQKPMIGWLEQTVEFVNEWGLLVSFWLMFLFTDYVGDPEKRLEFGD